MSNYLALRQMQLQTVLLIIIVALGSCDAQSSPNDPNASTPVDAKSPPPSTASPDRQPESLIKFIITMVVVVCVMLVLCILLFCYKRSLDTALKRRANEESKKDIVTPA